MIDQTSAEPVLASPVHEERRRRISLVWLMPLLALLVAGWVVWSNYQDRGPLITIAFQSASGIRAGATEVRIRDLRVGVVEEVGFADGMASVEALVRIDKNVAQYIDEDAEFWLVEPQVTARGVTGIGTLLSGVYIAASWNGEVGTPVSSFTALETPPLATPGESGTRVVLRTRAGGQLAAGAPVLARGIEVGRIGQPVLSASGTTVTMDAFIAATYDRRLTTNARFWDASGLSVNVGAEGLAVKVNSLAALLEGGVTFGTPVTGGERVEDGHVFDVFATEAIARADAFEANSLQDIKVSLLLDSDVNGLGVGTVVRFRGVKVGEVQDVVGIAPPEGSDEPVKLRIDANLSPTRLGFPSNLRPESVREAFATRVANGLRLRVASEGLFGQTVILELAEIPTAEPAEIVDAAGGRMQLPTVEAATSKSSSGVDGLVERVSNLPIEDLMGAATGALSGVTQLAATAESVLASEGVSKIPKTVDETLSEVRSLVAEIRNDGAVAGLIGSAASTLESVNKLTGSAEGVLQTANGVLGTAQGVLGAEGMDRIPQSVEQTLVELRKLLADIGADGKAGALVSAATTALESVTALTGSAQTVLGADGMDKLPETMNATLAEVRTLVADLREGGAVENLNAALKSADEALKNANSTLKSVDDAASTLPELAKRLNGAADGLQAVVAGYNTQSRFYQDVRETLRAVSTTAESFRSLARSIERNPSSLIRGR